MNLYGKIEGIYNSVDRRKGCSCGASEVIINMVLIRGQLLAKEFQCFLSLMLGLLTDSHELLLEIQTVVQLTFVFVFAGCVSLHSVRS